MQPRLTRSLVRVAQQSAARSVASRLSSSMLTRSASLFRGMTLSSAPSSSFHSSSPALGDMFCRQCEQTSEQKGCTVVGVCGKTPEVAALQDLLVYGLQGMAQYAHAAREINPKYADDEINRFTLTAMFSTLTNVNFDGDAIAAEIQECKSLRDKAKALYLRACKENGVAPKEMPAGTPAFFVAPGGGKDALVAEAKKTASLEIRKKALGEDLAGLAEMVIYGLKGTCAYAEHAYALGGEDAKVYANIHKCLAGITNPSLDLPSVLALVDLVGATNLRVMELLDNSGTGKYGHPVPTEVSTTPKPGKCILVSGHDLVDLENILQQCEGTGVNVYTHGEMLPAHGYPGLKKYSALAGHYGGPWQLQKFEFAQFPGAIVMTTNCLVEPMKSYKGRIFTRSVTGWPGVPHISNQDYSALIKCAKSCEGFDAEDIKPSKPLMTGFARNTVLGVADKVIGAIKSGDIKHFFVIGGCDGSESERSYFTDLAKSTPKDSVILTLGCGKYRFNREDLGTIGGLPRMMDMGQCNDAYSGIQIALALANALKTDVNSLPLSFAVSWFEQKAVAVLLTLLHLNIQNIRLGTHLPAFITPNVLKVLIDKYQIKQANHKDVASDLKNMLANH